MLTVKRQGAPGWIHTEPVKGNGTRASLDVVSIVDGQVGDQLT